jgi:UPF0271 protein
MDINCDMGEGIGHDEELMPFISSANIACGYHAGDESTMRRTIRLCLQYGVKPGAHPSFADKENFGRTMMHLPGNKIYDLVIAQLNIISAIAVEENTKLHHVKPHGALYNMAAKDSTMAKAIARAVKDFDSTLMYYGLSGSVMIEEAMAVGLRTASEVFADRTYQPDGSLTSRSLPKALITKVEAIESQVLKLYKENKVTAINGEEIFLKADTLCIHGDGEHAVEFAKAIYKLVHEK